MMFKKGSFEVATTIYPVAIKVTSCLFLIFLLTLICNFCFIMLNILQDFKFNSDYRVNAGTVVQLFITSVTKNFCQPFIVKSVLL